MNEHSLFELDDSTDSDDRVQVCQSIAEGLATLSEASDTPNEVVAPTSRFEPEDVEFESGAWITRLIEVQGWLFFDDLPTQDRKSFLDSLVRNLGLAPATAILRNTGDYQLSLDALERLHQRVQDARRFQEKFLEEVENEDSTMESATQAWVNAWEETDINEAEPEFTPISAKADVMPISEFTDSDDDDLNLTPTYQRGDVWTNSDRQALLESVLRGIPIPSIILLETGPDGSKDVVDGKQRLTALLRFVGRHPVAIEKVKAADEKHPDENLLKLFQTDYPKFRRAWKQLEGEALTTKLEDTYYFPFKLRNSGVGGLVGETLEPLQGKYYTEISDRVINVGGSQTTIRKLFTKSSAPYKVPVILYESTSDPRQIHEVFKLYNKQGVHLNAEELRNAAYHELEFARAILVAAGDVDRRHDLSEVAPSLRKVAGLQELGHTLTDYNFGTTRYRRTKVLSWVLSALLLDTNGERLNTTARHIDQLLDRVQKDPQDSLRKAGTLSDLFEWIIQVIEIHATSEVWAPSFKTGKTGKGGTRWQELQLVGSLVGVAVATAGAPVDIISRINQHADRLYDASETEWLRPKKATTKTQWAYIAQITNGILEILNINSAEAAGAVRSRFGSSGVESLMQGRSEVESRTNGNE